MRTLAILALLLLASFAHATGPAFVPAAPEYKMVTASERGTYFPLCQDMAKFVAPDAGFDLECLPSAGSSENVFRLRFEPGVKLAIVQADVVAAFLDKATENRDAGNLIRPIKAVARLYPEEIYFAARADSPLNYVHEIKDARIAAGAYGSGTALSAITIYKALFGTPMPRPQYMSNEDALVKLIGDKSVDVVVIVGGQPMKLLADMKPEVRQLLKLLKFDSGHGGDVLKTYVPATIRKTSYPNLLEEDIPGVAVVAYLAVYDYNLLTTRAYLAKFAQSLCRHFPELQASGHPKWKEVSLELPELGTGWSYYYPTAREIKACGAPKYGKDFMQTRPACGQVEFTLGLCDKPNRDK